MNVTYIFGAGVSMDFKKNMDGQNPLSYPSGKDLIVTIIDYLNGGNLYFEKSKDRLSECFDEDTIKGFKNRLSKITHNSIDKFLSIFKDEFGDIGKFCITDIFKILQEQITLIGFEDSLYSYLFSKIIKNDPHTDLYNISFITYNYDLLLEYSLIRVMKDYKYTDDQINNFLSGALAGFLAIGFLQKASRMTWSGYLLARAFDAFYKHLINKKVIKKREIHYIFIFALMYGFYGYCIAMENDVIPTSIAKFFNSVYKSTYEKNRFTLNSVLAQKHSEDMLRKYGKMSE